MARKLVGFYTPKKSGASDSDLVNLVVSSALAGTKYGEFNTPEEVDSALVRLKALPTSVESEVKINEMEAKKTQLETKRTDVMNDKNVFDTQLQDAKIAIAKNNLANPRAVIGNFAALYADAYDKYQTDVMAKIYERYGTTGDIPAEVTAYLGDLKAKAAQYAALMNSYNPAIGYDPADGKVGPKDPGAIAFKIDTNPATGNMVNIDIVTTDGIDSKNYMRTDTNLNMGGNGFKQLPVYLRTYDQAADKEGNVIKAAVLGGLKYEGTTSKQTDDDSFSQSELKLVSGSESLIRNIRRVFMSDAKEKEKFGSDVRPGKMANRIKEDGLDFSQNFKFDSNDVPADSLVRVGNRYFYSNPAGKLDEISGKTIEEKMKNFNGYMKSLGKDPSQYAVPYYATKDALYNADGTLRTGSTITDKGVGVGSLPSSSVSGIPNGGKPQVTSLGYGNSQTSDSALTPSIGPSSIPGNAEPAPVASFFGNKNTPNKPDAPAPVTQGGKTSFNDLVDKGKSFFRSLA